jgi:hypothetical protein
MLDTAVKHRNCHKLRDHFWGDDTSLLGAQLIETVADESNPKVTSPAPMSFIISFVNVFTNPPTKNLC